MLLVLGCAGPEATVTISGVSGTDAVAAGEYVTEEITVVLGGGQYAIAAALDEEELCTTLDVRLCEIETPGVRAPATGNWSCAAGDQPLAFAIGVTTTCNVTLATWTGLDSLNVEVEDDEVRLTYDGELDGSGTTPGNFWITADVLFLAGDVVDDAEE